MANDLMIPESGIPAHILALGAAAVAADNADAVDGLLPRLPPRIKLNGTKFVLVNDAGEEMPYPASKLFIGPDENQYMPVVVLKSKKGVTKSFYLKKYNKDEEGAAPDCWSDDGKRPDVSVLAPISDVCASCPKHAFGTATDQDGNPTKGRACPDRKTLAVFVPGFGIYKLSIPPSSHKFWDGFVTELTRRNIPLGTIKTLIGFDPTMSFPVLIFKHGGYIDEKSLPKLQAMAASPEVLEIIGGTAPAPAQKALPASQEVIDQPAEDDAKKKAAEAAAKKKADAAAKKKKADEAAAAALAAKTPPPGDDLDLDMSFESNDPAPSAEAGGTSDDELAAALGL